MMNELLKSNVGRDFLQNVYEVDQFWDISHRPKSTQDGIAISLLLSH